MADLVWHLTQVHEFWRTIALERPSSSPPDSEEPARPALEKLVDGFEAGATELVQTLRETDQDAPTWTWFPGRQDVGFITRHQVQETAVHHWDTANAANAAGPPWSMDPAAAADSVSEFLTCSLADADDVARHGRRLTGPVVLVATDIGAAWTVAQETPDSALLWSAGAAAPPTVSGSVADLLLWIYGRRDLEVGDPARVAEFRSLSSST